MKIMNANIEMPYRIMTQKMSCIFSQTFFSSLYWWTWNKIRIINRRTKNWIHKNTCESSSFCKFMTRIVVLVHQPFNSHSLTAAIFFFLWVSGFVSSINCTFLSTPGLFKITSNSATSWPKLHSPVQDPWNKILFHSMFQCKIFQYEFLVWNFCR